MCLHRRVCLCVSLYKAYAETFYFAQSLVLVVAKITQDIQIKLILNDI